MKTLQYSILGSLSLLSLLGCESAVEPPPALTPDLQAQIEQEQKAVEDQERAQQQLSRAKK